jgi:hypothetical protein
MEGFMVLLRMLVLGCAVLLAGCATVTGNSTQSLQLEVFDAQDRPVLGMECRLSHLVAPERSDASPAVLPPIEVVVMAPARHVEVRRSGNALLIECRKGREVAVATVHPRREGLEQALVPFGSVAVLIDHVSGNLYAYPTELRLRLGQSVQLEHGGQSRVMSSEHVAGAVTTEEAVATAARPAVAVAAVKPVPLQAVKPVARTVARSQFDTTRPAVAAVAAARPAMLAIAASKPARIAIDPPKPAILSIVPPKPAILSIETTSPATVTVAAGRATPDTW